MDFFSGVSATMGNELTPSQVKSQPILSWPTDPRGFYTVCMIGMQLYSFLIISNNNLLLGVQKCLFISSPSPSKIN